MRKNIALMSLMVCILTFASGISASGSEPNLPDFLEIASNAKEFSKARLEPVQMDGKNGIAVIFEGTEDLHYYANPQTAPAPGFELQVKANSEHFKFGKPVFPKPGTFTDPLGTKVEVYAGNFKVFIPIESEEAKGKGPVEVVLSGVACTSMLCLPPFEISLGRNIDFSQSDTWGGVTVESPTVEHKPVAITTTTTNYSAVAALALAFLAGLILNIMPCVLPVIPLKVLSIFEQAKESKARCIALGLMFCLGILLFFIGLAGVNIVLRIFYETAFQWGDHFRRPIVLIGMSLLMVGLALFMFGVFNVGLPSSVAGRSSGGKGYAGSVSMGFLAAILSTPCSFAILTAAFAWAQTQPVPLATAAILAIGLGMASPYAILTSMPGLLKYLPKPGRWMELFKQAMGFVLLVVAIWLIQALSEERRTGVLYFAVVLGLCLWMWGGWVNFNTPVVRKWTIRTIAGVIAIGSGLLLLPKPLPSEINWLDYDRDAIQTAVASNQPVLIEFMAEWCLTCKVIEKTVYKRKDISDLIGSKGVLAIQADTTKLKKPATIDLSGIYKEPGVPVSILYSPGIAQPERLHGMLIGDKLKKLLESLPDKPNAP